MSTAGTTARLPAARGFGWQATLILLPVLALAAAGIWALRQDRRAAEQELAGRAQALADETAQRVMTAFFPTDNGNPRLPDFASQPPRATNYHVFALDTGRTGTASPLAPTPVAWDLVRLNPRQRELWQPWAEGKIAGQGQEQTWLREFLAAKPADAFLARAEFEAATAALARGQTQAAVAGFERALPLTHGVMTEAGLPLEQLVQLRLLELWPLEKIERVRHEAPAGTRQPGRPGNFASWLHPWLFQAIQGQPSPAAAWMAAADRRGVPQEIWRLMPGAEGAAHTAFSHRDFWEWQLRGWEAAQAVREHLAAQPPGAVPRFFRCGGSRGFLVARLDLAAGSTNAYSLCHCLPAEAVEDLVQRTTARMNGVPGYLGLAVELAGATVGETPAGRRLATSAPLALAPELSVSVTLADPPAFYAALRQRTLWFGGLIGCSTLAALAGLFAAWRAFLKQQRLAELKSNFVSSVSHELRAPVASIRLMIESLESGKVSQPGKPEEYFRFISQECRRLSALIENVLDFARIDQGRKQYEFEPTDAAALVKASLQLLEPAAREKGITLRLQLAEAGLATVTPCWDGRAIQQALINLLDNALKYSAKGTTVTLRVTPDGAGLRLAVEDQGVGIPTGEQQRIFERFYRVGTELRRETQGVGIGLSIVKHIVEAHGGRVTVRSTVGQGSCFTMELPAEGKP
jgi:signal transduction histidine kinase